MRTDEVQQYANLPSGSVVILQALVGSTVHGTAVAGTDDRDEMAIVIEPPEKAIGLHGFETMVYRTQPEGVRSGPGDLDLVIHTLRKFTRLAARGNPSILLPLWVPPSALVGKTHALGHKLRESRGLFLSKRVGKSFLGYLTAQKQRLTGERGQMRVKRQDLIDQYGFDSKYAGHVIRLAHQGIELMSTGHLSLPMRKAEAEEVLAIRTGKLTLQQTLERADELERALEAAVDDTKLPADPDERAIDRLIVGMYLSMWRPL